MSMVVTARLRPPDRIVEVADVRRVADLLARLEVLPGAVLVIRDGALLTSQDELRDGDKVEVRFAISGGSGGLMQAQPPEGSGEPRRGAPVDQAPWASAPRWNGGS
jgi:sulfur carrier protein ThiS